MKLSISNIAWEQRFENQVIKLLQKHEIYNIDFAPGKFFSDIKTVSDAEIQSVRNKWINEGFSFAGMQSLLYGTSGLNLFDIKTQASMLEHLKKVCHIGAVSGAEKLVFGSPKNRNRNGLSNQQTDEIALDFFYRLGEISKSEGVKVCLEANPVTYGTNFLTSTGEAAVFVRKLNHSNIRLQLDLGTIYTNKEPPAEIEQYAELTGHIHISEAAMAPTLLNDEIHRQTADILKKVISEKQIHSDVITIEMLTDSNAADEERLNTIEKSIVNVQKLYMPN